MPYKKVPELRYKLFGGINTKISQYLNSPMEFLSLENFDFQVPGSLTQRWGSTQLYQGSSYFNGQVYGLFNYNQITGNSSMIVAGSTTAYYSAGAGLTNLLGAVSHGTMTGFATYINFATFAVTSPPAASGFQGQANYDFQVFNNNLYACNGKDFWRWNGSSFYFFGVPLIGAEALTFLGASNPTWGATTQGASVSGGLTGSVFVALAYVNNMGVVGNATVAGGALNSGLVGAAGATAIAVTFSERLIRAMNPGYGVSTINVYMTQPLVPTSVWANGGAPFYFVGSVGLSSAPGSGLTLVISATTLFQAGPTTAITQTIPYGRWYYSDDFSPYVTGASYQLIPGGTLSLQSPGDFSNASIAQHSLMANVKAGNMVPSMMENIDGTMFMAGASYFLSTVFWSDFDIPERIGPTSNLEVRTNDGEIVTAIKSYNGNLIITKQSSFHNLNVAAENPENWSLTQVSSEYGCVSNRAICEYANYLVFLDRKGIIRYNGANIDILSTKVDPIFQRMNVAACKDAANITYDKTRNEILCDIPVDGSTVANLTVVYDIISQAWTTEKGYRPSSRVRSQIPSKDAIVYGGYSGLIGYFGSSFLTDNGVGFTLIAKSGFLTDLGESVTKMFRRLFLDTNPIGSSSFIDVNFYQDFGSSRIISATMMLSNFQQRMDFGISGKSLSAEFMCGSTLGLALHGFAIQYRFQRNV